MHGGVCVLLAWPWSIFLYKMKYIFYSMKWSECVRCVWVEERLFSDLWERRRLVRWVNPKESRSRWIKRSEKRGEQSENTVHPPAFFISASNALDGWKFYRINWLSSSRPRALLNDSNRNRGSRTKWTCRYAFGSMYGTYVWLPSAFYPTTPTV